MGFALSSRRSQHLVFLAHVWLCTPFMVPWLRDPAVHAKLGDAAIGQLRPVVAGILVYLITRTYLAWRDPAWLRWDVVFPPIDVVIISLILWISHRGPLSNLTMLYFLPIIQASGSLNVRWAAGVGVMVVVGTVLATQNPPLLPPDPRYHLDPALMGTRELFETDPLNATFRIFFLIVISSLMTFQALIAAEYRSVARVEAERNQVALEMHDGVQGSLISLASQLELIGLLATRDPARAGEVAREAREVARQATDELRFVVQRLRAPALGAGFVPALRQYAHNVCVRENISLEFEVLGVERLVHPDAEQALFRIAQEALTNVVKHARATQVRMEIAFETATISVSVEDDGVGLGSEPLAGIGLAGMRARAEDQSGEFYAAAGRLGGARVQVSLPTG